MSLRKSREDARFDAINLVMVVLVTVVLIYPLLFVLTASISDPHAVNRGEVILFPRGISVESYELVLKEPQVWRGYLNTLYYVSVDVVLSLVVILAVSYALSRPDRLKGAGIITFVMTFTMIFQGGIIPLYLVMRGLRLINTVWAITLPNTAAVYLIIVSRTYFRTTLPQELYDASEMDGATFTQTFFLIVIPLSKAIIAVVALFRGVAQWNAFFQPLMFLTERSRYPLQLVLRNILLANESFASADALDMAGSDAAAEVARRGELAETMKFALIVVSSAPVLMIYPFLQKHLMKGVMLGALKA